MAKKGDKNTVKIKGDEYTFQHPGVRWYIKHTDQCKDQNNNLNQERYIEGLLEMVVIQDVEIDDFDEMDGGITALQELVQKIENFLGT